MNSLTFFGGHMTHFVLSKTLSLEERYDFSNRLFFLTNPSLATAMSRTSSFMSYRLIKQVQKRIGYAKVFHDELQQINSYLDYHERWAPVLIAEWNNHYCSTQREANYFPRNGLRAIINTIKNNLKKNISHTLLAMPFTSVLLEGLLPMLTFRAYNAIQNKKNSIQPIEQASYFVSDFEIVLKNFFDRIIKPNERATFFFGFVHSAPKKIPGEALMQQNIHDFIGAWKRIGWIIAEECILMATEETYWGEQKRPLGEIASFIQRDTLPSFNAGYFLVLLKVQRNISAHIDVDIFLPDMTLQKTKSPRQHKFFIKNKTIGNKISPTSLIHA